MARTGLGASGWGRMETAFAWVIVGIGVALRLVRFFHRHSMWLDESMLSINIVSLPWGKLFGRLLLNQVAPVGFLGLEKVAVGMLGTSELALRVVPLLAGVGALVAAYFLFRRAVGGWGGLWALGVFALAEEGLNYVSEVKQYSMDLLVTTVMLWLGLRAIQERRGLWGLTLVGGMGIWFSHAAVFVTAGIGVVFAWQAIRELAAKSGAEKKGDFFGAGGVAAMGVFWVGSFAALYFLTLRSVSGSEYLQEYWVREFPPLPLSMGDVNWYFSTVARIPLDVLRWHEGPGWMLAAAKVGAGLCVLMGLHGFLVLWEEKRELAAIVGATVGCMFLAAAVRQYPLMGRLMLFAMPLWLVLAGASVGAFFRARRNWFSVLGRVAALMVVVYAGVSAGMTAAAPPVRSDMRAVMDYLAGHAEGGDAIYAMGTSTSPLRFYLLTTHRELERTCVFLFGRERPWEAAGVGEGDDVATFFRVERHGRVWLVFSDLTGETRALVEQRDRAVAGFSAVGRRVEHVGGEGTEVDLFELP